MYQTNDVQAVDMRRYLADLVQSLSAAYNYTAADFDLVLEVAPLQLEIDVAVPLRLILNELLTNTFKYVIGLPGPVQPALRVALDTMPDGGLLLEVQDNGPGFDPAAEASGRSFGQRLIAALTGQLGGACIWMWRTKRTIACACQPARLPSCSRRPKAAGAWV